MGVDNHKIRNAGSVKFDVEVNQNPLRNTIKNKILLASKQRQSPAIDVCGIGLEDGRIILHNLRYDETVMSFSQEWGPVTSLTFRTGDFNSRELKYI